MVGPDPSGNGQLEVLCLGDPLAGQVGGPERLRDHDVRVDKLLLEHRARAVLVGGDDERVAGSLEVPTQAQLARNAAQQLPGREVDGVRGRGRLAARIRTDLWYVVARVGRRIAVDRIVIKHTKHFGHGLAPLLRRCGVRPVHRATSGGGSHRPASHAMRSLGAAYASASEGAAGRSEPATANATIKRATMSQKALRRPTASASTPMTGGPARLAK